MKKLSAVFTVIMVMVSLVYFTNVSMASKAGVVSISSPSNNAISIAVVPTFGYNLNSAKNCLLRVSTSSDLTNVLSVVRDMSITDGSTSQQLDVTLASSTQYYWGIKAGSESSFTPVTVFHFTTQ